MACGAVYGLIGAIGFPDPAREIADAAVGIYRGLASAAAWPLAARALVVAANVCIRGDGNEQVGSDFTSRPLLLQAIGRQTCYACHEPKKDQGYVYSTYIP